MREILIEIEKMINSIETATTIWERTADINIFMDIRDAITAINQEMYGCASIEEAPVSMEHITSEEMQKKVQLWLQTVRAELEIRKKILPETDFMFHNLVVLVQHASKEELVQKMKNALEAIRSADEHFYSLVRNYYHFYSYFWGDLDLDQGIYDLFINRAEQLKDHLEDFIWLYHELGDYRSKKVLFGILNFWVTFDYAEKDSLRENNFSDYFDYDLISCTEDEVFVDLGAYKGDSARSYIKNYGSYKKIYCYEITPKAIEDLKAALQSHENIVIRPVGVGKECSTMYMQNFEANMSSNLVSDSEGIPVEIVTLDEDITEPITFLKMDIEGSELNAINGAVDHLRNDKPKLAISTYHNHHHIWEIPRRIREINPDYQLYMRYNGSDKGVGISEYILFGV